MKLFISSDLEGTAGIVDWDQCRPEGGAAWQEGRALLTAEVNAAIRGASDAGVDEIVVNDSHGLMRTVLPLELDPRARLIQGRHKHMYMLEGLDSSFDLAFFISYHGGAGCRFGILNHSYSPYATRLNGHTADETLINALVAGSGFGVAVALVTGDEVTRDAAHAHLGAAVETVVTKQGITRNAADSLHPHRACQLIEAGARIAAGRRAEMQPLRWEGAIRWEIDLLTSVQADRAELIPGVERAGDRTVSYTDVDIIRGYRAYQAMIFLARTVE